jgi:recombination protein RecT
MTQQNRNAVARARAAAPQAQQATVSTTLAATRLTAEQQKLARINARLARGNFTESLKQVLPKQSTPDRFVRTVLLAVHQKPALLDCTEESIAMAALQIASWGLDIGRTAHMVPYKNGDRTEAQAQVDWKGMIELAIRGKSISSCRVRIIHKNDDIDIQYGLQERVHHVPVWQGDPGEPIGVYAIVRFANGDQLFDLMSKADVERIRDRYSKAYKFNKAGRRGPWESDPDEMWKKTVVRRALKMVPQNPLLAQVLALDEDDRQATAAEVLQGVYGTPPVKRGVGEASDYGLGTGTVGNGHTLPPGEPGEDQGTDPAQASDDAQALDGEGATECPHGVSLDATCVECAAETGVTD